MRHSVRARLLQTLTCAGCALALPGSALGAGGSPLHIDPASPVAKEYALPLSVARGAAPESGRSGKLFGSGITHAETITDTSATAPPPVTTTVSRPAATTTTRASSSTPVPRPHPRARHHRRVHPVTRTHTTPQTGTNTTAGRQIIERATPTAYRVLRPGSGSGLLWMLAAALLVLAIGGVGGIALRRRR